MRVIRLLLGLWVLCGSARAANLVPNSSFESGYSRGWVEWGTGNSSAWGNLEFGSGLLTNDAWHGRYSIRMPTGARLASRNLGQQNAGTYTVSFYGRGSVNMPFGIFQEASLAVGANPPNTAALTGTWTRYSASLTTTTNGCLWVRFGPTTALAEIDAVQLETGSSATTYAPESTVELGLSISGTNNTKFNGDSPTFTINLWNEGSAGNVQARYEIFNLWNSNVVNGIAVLTAAAGTNSSATISMPPQKGWFNIRAWLTSYADSRDEITTVVYPFASNVVSYANTAANLTNGWLGGHGHISPFHVNRELLANRTWTRGSLSPNSVSVRWQTVQPSTNTQFNVFAECFTNYANGGLNQVVCLTPTDGTWNPWATNADGTASMTFWRDYCSNMVRYVCVTLALTNTYFEVGPNEPYQTGPTSPLNVQIATNYAKALTYGVWGCTQGYATAKIIGIAGAYGDAVWADEVVTNLSAGTLAAITVISTHEYPQDNSLDPNIGEYEATRFSRPGPWVARFGSTKEVWNTESGTYTTGPILGLNGFWPDAYDVHWTPTFEATRSEWMNRQLVATCRILPTALRCIGYGFQKFFYYDTRYFNDSSFAGSQPYAADYLQVDQPFAVSLSVASWMVRKGFGPITNNSAYPYVELYCFTNASGQAVVAGWSVDRRNKALTLTNSNFALWDCMGNQLQTNSLTARLCRVPEYFVSGTLTLAQLSNTLANATVSTVADVLAPQISLDIAPTGLWSGDTNYVLFKWSAIDDTYTAWNSAASCTNVQYRWKLDAGGYSAYSQSNHVWIPSLSAGNHTFTVGAVDAAGNTSERSTTFVGTPGDLAVAGTWTVNGNVTIGP